MGGHRDLPRCGTSRSNQSWSSCCLWPAWGWRWLKDRTGNTSQRETVSATRRVVLIERVAASSEPAVSWCSGLGTAAQQPMHQDKKPSGRLLKKWTLTAETAFSPAGGHNIEWNTFCYCKMKFELLQRCIVTSNTCQSAYMYRAEIPFHYYSSVKYRCTRTPLLPAIVLRCLILCAAEENETHQLCLHGNKGLTFIAICHGQIDRLACGCRLKGHIITLQRPF